MDSEYALTRLLRQGNWNNDLEDNIPHYLEFEARRKAQLTALRKLGISGEDLLYVEPLLPHWTDFPKPKAPEIKIAKIQTLPYDMVEMIMKDLDTTSSTCLGLTCRDFYNTHWKIHGPVKLMPPKPTSQIGLSRPLPTQLPALLSFWMEWGAGLKYRVEEEKFVTVKRWLELDEGEYGRYGLEQRLFNSEVGTNCANWDDWKHLGPRVRRKYTWLNTLY